MSSKQTYTGMPPIGSSRNRQRREEQQNTYKIFRCFSCCCTPKCIIIWRIIGVCIWLILNLLLAFFVVNANNEIDRVWDKMFSLNLEVIQIQKILVTNNLTLLDQPFPPPPPG